MPPLKEQGRIARLSAGLAGLVLLAAFFGLDQTATGLRIGFHPQWDLSDPGEIYFWLGHALLVMPGAALLGVALAPWLGPRLEAFSQGLARLNTTKRIAVVLAVGVLAFLVARVGHTLVLEDFAITDDENAARFGGQVLASGHWRAPLLIPRSYFPGLFMTAWNGGITSFDFPGTLFAWAAGEVAGVGPLVFHLAAAVPIPVVGVIVGRRLGPGWGALAALLVAFSPMAFSLSLTTHAHLLSRAALALALLALTPSAADAEPSRRAMALGGLALGLGFLARPAEILLLAFPLCADLLFRAIRRRAVREALWLVVGGLGPVLAFLAYNWAITGNPLVPARNGPGVEPSNISVGNLWNRFGANVGYNILMLAVWFAGSLGLPLVAFGSNANRYTRALALGVVADLCLGLFHDDHGIHAVGPIHYSECVVPLAILALQGLHRAAEVGARANLAPALWAAPLVTGIIVGLGIFDFWHGRALRAQADLQATIYDHLDSYHLSNAVVLAPAFSQVWSSQPALNLRASWVHEWRRPKPDLSDDVLILRNRGNQLPELMRALPGRRFYEMVPAAWLFDLKPLPAPEPSP
jgi:hypothetical protein